MKQNPDLILNYWKDFVYNASESTKDWLEKENEFLGNNISKGSIVLDVGFGLGRNIEPMIKIASKIIGIDSNTTFFNQTKQKLSKYSNVEVFEEDAVKMHFHDESFDFIICMGNTFGDFANNKIPILREMKRVLKNSGKIFVSLYSENALDIRIKEYERIGIKIKRIESGTIYTEDGLVLEQFDKNKLKNLFVSARLKVKITELTPISYICEATK